MRNTIQEKNNSFDERETNNSTYSSTQRKTVKTQSAPPTFSGTTITRLKASNRKAMGKVIRYANGEFTKRVSSPSPKCTAVHEALSSVDDLLPILESAEQNDILMLGHFKSSALPIGKPFNIKSQADLSNARKTGDKISDKGEGVYEIDAKLYTARLKKNTKASRIVMFDLDGHPQMPSEFVCHTAQEVQALLVRFDPSLGEVSMIICPSSSGRVIGPDGAPIFGDSAGWHVYVMVADSVDLEILPAAMKAHALITGMYWQKPVYDRKTGEILRHSETPFYDPAVILRPERLDFIAPPSITKKATEAGAKLADLEIQLIKGKVSEWAATGINLNEDHVRATLKEAGINLNRSNTGDVILTVDDLKLDTLIDLGDGKGTTTVHEWYKNGGNKVRCQTTPFRESTSMNGYLNKHEDETPFMFDNGERVKHILNDEEISLLTAPQLDPDNPLVSLEEYEVSEEEIANLKDAKFIIDGLIIHSHLVAIAAPPNGGKTTIFFHLSKKMAQKGHQVIYVNADISAGDAGKMATEARKHKVKLLLPDMKPGKSMSDIVGHLEAMNAQDINLSGIVFIFDTLKKMTDVINKSHSKELYAMLRGLSMKGATIILLGHTNKYKGENDKLVYEGTGDLRADVDELIYMYPVKNDDGSMTVSTEVDKSRGAIRNMTFEISAEREVTQKDEFINTKEIIKQDKQKTKDSAVIAAIKEAIESVDEDVTQSQIVKHCTEREICGKDKARNVLMRYEGDLWENYRTKEGKHALFYRLLDLNSQDTIDIPEPGMFKKTAKS